MTESLITESLKRQKQRIMRRSFAALEALYLYNIYVNVRPARDLTCLTRHLRGTASTSLSNPCPVKNLAKEGCAKGYSYRSYR